MNPFCLYFFTYLLLAENGRKWTILTNHYWNDTKVAEKTAFFYFSFLFWFFVYSTMKINTQKKLFSLSRFIIRLTLIFLGLICLKMIEKKETEDELWRREKKSKNSEKRFFSCDSWKKKKGKKLSFHSTFYSKNQKKSAFLKWNGKKIFFQ